MSNISRRQLLTFFGVSAGAAIMSDAAGNLGFGPFADNAVSASTFDGLSFTPIRLPHALPIYTTKTSFLPTGLNGVGINVPPNDGRLFEYNVIDDVHVPPEYERYQIVAWGDRVYPNPDDYFGYNNDYTGYVRRSDTDGILFVNHEYVSYPFSPAAPGASDDFAGTPGTFPEVVGFALPSDSTDPATQGEFMYNVGGSILRIVRDAAGRFTVAAGDPLNRRIHGLSGLGINAERTDGYQSVTSWGTRSHQIGNQDFLIGTGPVANDVFLGINADGLGNRIIGTGFNCSGATTPWATFLTAEENFQASSTFFVGVQEAVGPNGSQTGYVSGTTGETFGLIGEKYGYMVEINANPSIPSRKHTALGRFRHENAAIRAEAGQRLVVYMGDDRRGGHTWKFVSDGTVTNPGDPNNSALLESGTLYAAKFNTDGSGTGVWIPLVLSTPTGPISPSDLSIGERSVGLEPQRAGRIRLPKRAGIAGETENGGSVIIDVDNEAALIGDYFGRTLADFYTSQGAVLADAFLAANLAGATPTGRPEDLEVNPRNPDEVFIAYTDGIAGGDGYPDSRVLQVGKLRGDVNADQPSGALFKIIDSGNGAGGTFRWQPFVQAGEVGSNNGGGFANVDNLAFDPQGNIWGVTDMSTSRQNGFRTGANPRPRTIDHTDMGATDALVGVYGNNWVFYIPTSGEEVGQIVPFAYGPNRCEITGPTFVGDTLIVAVQHPGEDTPIGGPSQLSASIEMLDLQGNLYSQFRTVNNGSAWPSSVSGTGSNPRPAVIGIRRREPLASGQFV